MYVQCTGIYVLIVVLFSLSTEGHPLALPAALQLPPISPASNSPSSPLPPPSSSTSTLGRLVVPTPFTLPSSSSSSSSSSSFAQGLLLEAASVSQVMASMLANSTPVLAPISLAANLVENQTSSSSVMVGGGTSSGLGSSQTMVNGAANSFGSASSR